jgi:hypothetical protein
LAAALAVALALQAGSATAQGPVRLKAVDLNGAAVEIPAGAARGPVLLLVGFRHNDRKALDGWRKGLGLQTEARDWYEIPVIPPGAKMVGGLIMHAMQKGATTDAQRAHLAPTFADAAEVAAQLGVDRHEPAVVVVDRSGRVLARAGGPFDPAKARELTVALGRRTGP